MRKGKDPTADLHQDHLYQTVILHIQIFCIPSPPPDLDCSEIPKKNFKVTGSDPHGFDADNDGIGCESRVRYQEECRR